MRFINKSHNKIFITSDNITKFEKKYNLFVINYKYKDLLFNYLKSYYIYYTDTRLFEEVQNLKNKVKVIYDLIDAPIDEFSVWKDNLKKSVIEANIVTYSHPKLIEILNEIDNSKIYHYVSNACDYEKFSEAKNRINKKPKQFMHIKKPILGYYGAFSNWIDYDIVKKHADENKYHIVMIGGIPTNKNYNIRFNHKNITWLNHIPYEDIPYYLSWFDVCFLPFKNCKLNEYVNPCKLWEYMATGKEIIKYNIDIEIDYNNIKTYDDISKEIENIL
jgi:hypothetical protein